MRFRIFLVVMSFLALTGTVWACWAAIAPEKYAEMCPLIVEGEIVDVRLGEVADTSWDVAVIRVDRVHVNAFTDYAVESGGTVEAKMSGTQSRMMMSTALMYPKGRKAIWMLVLQPSGEFALFKHPVQCQELDQAEHLESAGAFSVQTKRSVEDWKAAGPELEAKIWEIDGK